MIDALRVRCGYQMPKLGRLGFDFFKAVLPRHRETELFPGIRVRLDLREGNQYVTWWQGMRYEAPTVEIFQSWLPGVTTFFDIGSNYGFFTWLALSSAPGLRAHAFEPHPKTFALLRSIAERNRLTERVTCWNLGLGETEEVLPLHFGEDDLGWTTFGKPTVVDLKATLEARIRPFSAWRKELGLAIPSRPEWVAKIDVEGFEPKALHGMEEELRAKAFRGLVVEVNDDALASCGTTPAKVHDFMTEVGYRALTPESCPALRGGEPLNAFFVPV